MAAQIKASDAYSCGVQRLVAFDWNGTLVDDVERAWGATRAVLRERGLREPTLEEYQGSFRLPLALHFRDWGVAEGELAEAERGWNAAMAAGEVREATGAGAMLAALREAGYRVGVVSAAARETLARDIRVLGLGERLDFVIGSASPKRVALRGLVAAHPDRPVYVGDTEHDMEEALAAGALPVGYAGGYRPAEALRAAGAWRVIERLEELPGLIGAG